MSPIIIGIKTDGVIKPSALSPAWLKPYIVAPRPIVEYTSEIQSILGFVISVIFTRYFKAKRIEKTVNGITKINKNLQPKYSTIIPDSVGPIAGANIITSPTIPIILPLL